MTKLTKQKQDRTKSRNSPMAKSSQVKLLIPRTQAATKRRSHRGYVYCKEHQRNNGKFQEETPHVYGHISHLVLLRHAAADWANLP